MSRQLARALSVCLLAVAPALAEGDRKPSPGDKLEDPAHNELRKMRDELVEAVNAKDLDGVLKHAHPNVVAVWQDGTVSRGHAGVREYFDKHLGRPDATLTAYSVEVKIEELTALYGNNTGISQGTMTSRMTFRNGGSMTVEGPFTATLVKEDGRWLITSMHASVGVFDSPVAKSATTMMYWGIGIALAVGLAAGAGLMALLRRKPKAVGPAPG